MSTVSQTLNPTQVKAKSLGINLEALPAHIAIIMDGNGRFAQKKGLARLVGHRQGYKTLKKILHIAGELGIKYLTVYAFSAENWKRPEDEVSGLMKLIEDAALDEMEDLVSNNVVANVIGRIDEVPPSLQNTLGRMMQKTKNNTGIKFTLAINYGGRAEIVDAVKKLVRSGVKEEEITEKMISKSLYDSSLPDPDLMVRTAGEMRWSNYLIWQSAYTELFVTQTNWPEFGEKELLESVIQYQKRVRKFGGLA